MPPVTICTLIALIIVAAVAIARNHPYLSKRSELMRLGVQREIERWYDNTQWICVKVIDNDPSGPVGLSVRKIIVEGSLQRLAFCSFDARIVEGTKIRLRERSKEEELWVAYNPIGEFMRPEPI